MQHGFVSYVQGGEKRFAVPARIMGGVEGNPLLLFYHFFKIALYSIALHVRQAGIWGFPGAVLRSILVFASAVSIIWRPILDELMP